MAFFNYCPRFSPRLVLGAWQNAAKARWRVNPQSRRGVPDIIGFRNRDGLFIGVEVKAGRDQLRDDQRTFLNELRAANGLAFVAHDFAQFQQSFEMRGLHYQEV